MKELKCNSNIREGSQNFIAAETKKLGKKKPIRNEPSRRPTTCGKDEWKKKKLMKQKKLGNLQKAQNKTNIENDFCLESNENQNSVFCKVKIAQTAHTDT